MIQHIFLNCVRDINRETDIFLGKNSKKCSAVFLIHVVNIKANLDYKRESSGYKAEEVFRIRTIKGLIDDFTVPE